MNERTNFTNARDHLGRFASDNLIKVWLWRMGYWAFDMIFPPRCLSCGRVDSVWCDVCYDALVDGAVKGYEHEVVGLDGVISTAEHGGIYQEAVQALKYHGQVRLGQALGERLARQLQDGLWTFDMIIPVPIHMNRMRERGYNQSKYLSDVVGERLGVRVVDDGLLKVTATRPQVGLTAKERLENVRGAFMAEETRIRGQRILLVDDVLTTGATLRECAEVLRTHGAVGVYAITVNHAPGSLYI